VTKEFKNITFSATSSVTSDDVTEFISQADAFINSQLANKFTVPVTGTEALKIVKRLSIWLVTGRIKAILKVKTGQDIGDQGAETDLIKMAKDELKELSKGKSSLIDAPLISSADGVKSFAVDEGLEFTFKKGVDQW